MDLKFSSLANSMILSKSQVLCLLFSFFPRALLDAMVRPLFPFMVKYYFGSDRSSGYYSGLLASAYYLPLLVTNAIWGNLSDKYGAKSILILSLAFGIISTLILGLAETFWLAFAARTLAGLFGANSTIAKGRLGATAIPERRAWGYSV